MKRRPLRRGFSRRTISVNLAGMVKRGFARERATAAAYRSARRWWRKRHPRRALPVYLRPRANPYPSYPAYSARKKWRERAARALDLTHRVGERGPRTLQARERVATALDKGRAPARADVLWLEEVAAKNPRRRDAAARAGPRKVTREKVAAAARLYRDFHGRAPRHVHSYRHPRIDVGARVGRIVAILYDADHGERYVHKFTGASRPWLVSSHDGAQLAIVGGRFRMTGRGIVDH